MSGTEVSLAGAVNDSIVDGPGIRKAVFVQGCSHGCRGCQNPETHSKSGGFVKTVDDILIPLKANPLLDGLTLSGGEPLDQARAMIELADEAHALGLNVWCYTGYVFEDVLTGKAGRDARELLSHIDVLVDGPFIESQRSLDLHWKGSANQRVIDVPASLEQGHAMLWERP